MRTLGLVLRLHATGCDSTLQRMLLTRKQRDPKESLSMVNRTIVIAVLAVIVAAAGPIGCSSKKQSVQTAPAAPQVALPPVADDTAKVAISCAADYVPSGLKAGDMVTVQMIRGKTVAPN